MAKNESTYEGICQDIRSKKFAPVYVLMGDEPFFIDQITSETGLSRREVAPEAMQLLVDKSWTGNIRELRNVVERLLILSGNTITADDVRNYVY